MQSLLANLRGILSVALLAGSLGLSTSQLFAATWQSTVSTDWGTAGNWSGGVPNSAQANLPSSGTTQKTLNLNGSFTIDSMVIDDTLGNYNLTRTSTQIMTITPALSSNGISVTGGNTVLGNNANTFRITLGANQTWDVGTGSSLTIKGGGSNTAMTGAFQLTKKGAGTLTLNNSNAYGGQISSLRIEDGTMDTTSGAYWQINLTLVSGSGNALTMLGGTTMSTPLSLDNATAGQTIKFAGTSGTATLAAVTKQLNNLQNQTLTFDIDNGSANVDMTVGPVNQFANSGTATSNFLKTGAGTLRLTGSTSNYVGTSTLSQGQLLVGANAPVSAGGAFGNAATAVAIGGAGTSTTDNLSLLIDGGNYTIARAMTVNSNNSSGTTSLGINSAHSGIFSGNVTLNSHPLLVEAATGGTVTFSGNIVNGTGTTVNTLTKTGNGTVILSGVNTYGGTTTVGAGRLLVNNTSGSGTSTGAVTVQTGGTLGGSGSITGSVTVQSNGTLAPGQSAGILTVGSVNFNSGSFFDVEIGGNTPGIGGYDRLVVTNTATLGGTLDVSFLGGFVPAFNDQIIVLTANSVTGQFTNGSNGDWLTFDGLLQAQLFITGNQVYLTNFSVPEPSSFMLLGLGLVGMLRARRRSYRASGVVNAAGN